MKYDYSVIKDIVETTIKSHPESKFAENTPSIVSAKISQIGFNAADMANKKLLDALTVAIKECIIL